MLRMRREQSVTTANMSKADNVSYPQHIAIMMDGNGRWASKRMLPRFEGHRRGLEAMRRIIQAAADMGIRYLTLFSFSTENWSRPESEISDLMRLLKRFVRNDLAQLHHANIRVKIIGEDVHLNSEVIRILKEVQELTRQNTGLTLIVAFNHGSRHEIARAARRMAEAVTAGTLKPQDITSERLNGFLDTADIPDPDLVIRTSGEQRLSNFLLWQTAYSEFIFTPVLWPDFDAACLQEAIAEFQRRERRFGGLHLSVPARQMQGTS